jgi:cysteine synthase A
LPRSKINLPYKAALTVADKAAEGSVILAMLPDTGERYLSTALFEGVNEGSDDDWLDQAA